MTPQTRHGPGSVGALPEAANHTHRIANHTALAGYRALAGDSRPAVRTNPVALLLSRLQNVRQHGAAWRADCPVGHRSRGTLTVTEGADGRCLAYCFASCSVEEVAAAAGLELRHLFPPRVLRLTPAEREADRRRAREAGWAAALGVLVHEAYIVAAAAGMILQGTLTAEDTERLRLAVARVQTAREVLR